MPPWAFLPAEFAEGPRRILVAGLIADGKLARSTDVIVVPDPRLLASLACDHFAIDAPEARAFACHDLRPATQPQFTVGNGEAGPRAGCKTCEKLRKMTMTTTKMTMTTRGPLDAMRTTMVSTQVAMAITMATTIMTTKMTTRKRNR